MPLSESTLLKQHKEFIPDTDISFNMLEVKGGNFLLDDEIETEISSFWLSQHLVSQELWERMMGENPSHWKGKDRPVETVSWNDCEEFLRRLNYKLGLGEERAYRLPTAAEWEYAARGGTYGSAYTFSGSATLKKVGWHKDNSFKKTHVGGLKLPNILGIYDMSGNLWEWCQDWYQSNYPVGPLKDPKGPKSGQYRVLRGGSWNNEEQHCGVAIRFSHHPDIRFRFFGLRLSRTGL